MNKVLHKSTRFQLVQVTKRSKKLYAIMLHGWAGMSDADEERVRDIIDPFRARSGKYGLTWRFKKKSVADKYYFQLVLTFQ